MGRTGFMGTRVRVAFPQRRSSWGALCKRGFYDLVPCEIALSDSFPYLDQRLGPDRLIVNPLNRFLQILVTRAGARLW